MLSILDLTNAARAKAAVGSSVSEAVQEVENRLKGVSMQHLDNELHGRKAVDAALNLALAGCSTQWVFDMLAEQATREVQRWGHRKSCSSMTLCQLAERAAAAGFVAPLQLYDLIGGQLVQRGEPTFQQTAELLLAQEFGLGTSLQAARWVNRAAAKMDKISSASANEFKDEDIDWGSFSDPARPLAIDLGCGHGCGPLVYSSSVVGHRPEESAYNVLGCDLDAGGVAYARGLAARWGVAGTTQFARQDARAVLQKVRSAYPGTFAHRIVLSCPTPYAAPALLSDDDLSGNAQFAASSSADSTFLGHASVFDEAVATLAPGGCLYLASNVEDVALTLLDRAVERGLEPMHEAPAADLTLQLPKGAAPDPVLVPRRQARWREAGGGRAEGGAWAAARPMLWASETERSHIVERRPVHRVVLRKPG